MNILFLFSPSKLDDIFWTLKKMGHDVDTMNISFKYALYDEVQEEQLKDKLLEKEYEFVISFDFIPIISNVCERMQVKYASWTYDAPLMSLYTDSVKNKCNYLFLFDKIQCKMLKESGIEHVYHLPLAANINRISEIEIDSEDQERFSYEVSFVGDMYEKNDYNRIESYLHPDIKAKFDGYFVEITQTWDSSKNIYDYITDDVVNYFNKIFFKHRQNEYNISDKLFYGMSLMPKKVAQIDRCNILSGLSEIYDVTLHTREVEEDLGNVEIKGFVDYYSDMYKIFYLSKINLNICQRAIITGVPLRVFDVLGAGGFLISNYQEELTELFVEDKEIVLFKNYDELVDKIRYYLRHDDARKLIAYNGYKRVKENYTYENRINELINIVTKQ